jgi:hypothetical protein
MAEDEPIPVEAYYRYGYRGRDMIAIVSPFAMTTGSPEIVGRKVRAGDGVYRVLAVSRQISGPVQKGEPIGIVIDDPTSPQGLSQE